MIAVTWRVIWGLLGPTYARFASFAYRPATVFTHLQDLRRSRYHHHLGHNPLGAMMVFALLAVLAAIGLTGTMTFGGMLKQGPLRAFLIYATGKQALDLHNLLSILLLAMIGAHIAGVAFESWRSRENLVASMLTGDKPGPPCSRGRTARPRPSAATGSLRITDTPGWRRRHRGIAGTVFAANPVYRRSNCEACHADATVGRFAPQDIEIPALVRP